jgi:hypothetical protein
MTPSALVSTRGEPEAAVDASVLASAERKRFPGSNGNTVVFTHLEECEQFIKNVIRGHQGLAVPPHPCCGGPMIWVTADKVRKPGTGVDKHSHQSLP